VLYEAHSTGLAKILSLVLSDDDDGLFIVVLQEVVGTSAGTDIYR